MESTQGHVSIPGDRLRLGGDTYELEAAADGRLSWRQVKLPTPMPRPAKCTCTVGQPGSLATDCGVCGCTCRRCYLSRTAALHGELEEFYQQQQRQYMADWHKARRGEIERVLRGEKPDSLRIGEENYA
jgi:hypothetical protein